MLVDSYFGVKKVSSIEESIETAYGFKLGIIKLTVLG